MVLRSCLFLSQAREHARGPVMISLEFAFDWLSRGLEVFDRPQRPKSICKNCGFFLAEKYPNHKVLLCFVAVVAYQLCLKMGEVLGDGTEGNVFIQLFGDKGMTEQIQLRQAGNSKIRFEKGRTYKFTVETIDIGKVRFVRNVFS